LTEQQYVSRLYAIRQCYVPYAIQSELKDQLPPKQAADEFDGLVAGLAGL
jgi:hypothetical protein